MKKIQCIVVDDEPLARSLVTMYVARLTGWEVVAECRSVAEAYEALYQNSVDVIFLDINMPDKTGVDFLSTLKDPPLVVFTTAYAEYAAKAFDLKAADYLVKPITESRFREAVEKVERLIQNNFTPAQAQQTEHVFLKQDSKLVKVAFGDVLYVEALKDFSKLFLKDRTMLISAHLKIMEDLLPADRFLRVHRSYIISLDKINAVQGNVVEIGKQEIPVGTTYKEELLKRLRLH
ncbi:MAG TPA: LytTR family DNA-binding domain-containing protein [Flavisolibacter sp.]|jgi:DNA-binding LytR/AlgR family response regulator|nr:LytTR family DNA-binding domain-containing protein [Flavisolibacter sp.]